jgi:hypothetical protein
MPRNSQQALAAESERLVEHITELAQAYGPVTDINEVLCQAHTGLGVVMRLARRDYRTNPYFKLWGVCPVCGEETWSQAFENEVGLLNMHNHFSPSPTHKAICKGANHVT